MIPRIRFGCCIPELDWTLVAGSELSAFGSPEGTSAGAGCVVESPLLSGFCRLGSVCVSGGDVWAERELIENKATRNTPANFISMDYEVQFSFHLWTLLIAKQSAPNFRQTPKNRPMARL